MTKLLVWHDPPPIPIRTCDWHACMDGHEELATVHAPTREAAIADLREALEERGRDDLLRELEAANA